MKIACYGNNWHNNTILLCLTTLHTAYTCVHIYGTIYVLLRICVCVNKDMYGFMFLRFVFVPMQIEVLTSRREWCTGTRSQFRRRKATEESPTDRSAGVLVWCSIR